MTPLSLLWEFPLLRTTAPPLATWDALLPDQATRLPDELARIDAYLDDESFIVAWRAHFHARLGRPSIPMPTLLRLLYLKHRYGLGYESLCKEVSDSISWRRFCRIPLDRPVPHPTTLSKLIRRAGPGVIAQLNAALLAKLAADKLLRARKLRIDTTVVEADIDYPTDADLLEQAVRTLGGLVRRLKARGAAPRTAFGDRSRSAGRRLRQLTHSLRRRSGVAMGEVDRLTAQVATIARQSLRQTITLTGRLLWQTQQRLAGNRSIPDRVVSLADPDARPIRKGKPRSPTQFGYTLLLAEDERGFVADHLLSKGNPPTPHNYCRPCVAWPRCGAGRRAPWSPTAASVRRRRPPLAELGVRRIGLQRTGTPSRSRRELEQTRAFKRMRNWRVGIEARISHLKRSFGLRHTRLRRLPGARIWVGLGCSPTTCSG